MMTNPTTAYAAPALKQISRATPDDEWVTLDEAKYLTGQTLNQLQNWITPTLTGPKALHAEMRDHPQAGRMMHVRRTEVIHMANLMDGFNRPEDATYPSAAVRRFGFGNDATFRKMIKPYVESGDLRTWNPPAKGVGNTQSVLYSLNDLHRLQPALWGDDADAEAPKKDTAVTMAPPIDLVDDVEEVSSTMTNLPSSAVTPLAPPAPHTTITTTSAVTPLSDEEKPVTTTNAPLPVPAPPPLPSYPPNDAPTRVGSAGTLAAIFNEGPPSPMTVKRDSALKLLIKIARRKNGNVSLTDDETDFIVSLIEQQLTT